jgi:hypothetical protein
MGLLGIWREALVAKRLVMGEPVSPRAKHYANSGQLNRFSVLTDSISRPISSPLVRMRLSMYLIHIYQEGIRRNYKFNRELMSSIRPPNWSDENLARGMGGPVRLNTTTDQLEFELQLLKQRVYARDGEWFDKYLASLTETVPEPNPVFNIVWGPREEWDKGKLKPEWHSNWVRYCQLPASQTNHGALQKGEF